MGESDVEKLAEEVLDGTKPGEMSEDVDASCEDDA
jgi:hypothetical protein|tara:strand:- start:10875 stop:10979 length:105 start_codon:yes stop_codon:yes gene_type:complete